MKDFYNTPSVVGVFATKQGFGRKYAILRGGCKLLITNGL